MATTVRLTDEELLLLDGKCSPKAQEAVEKAKARLAVQLELPAHLQHFDDFIRRVVLLAQEEGKLVYQQRRTHRCPICKVGGEYATYRRSSRTHRRGEPDYSKPITLAGIELAERFVVVKDTLTLGCCTKCMEAIKPHLIQALGGVKAEMPEALMPTHWKKWDNMRCSKCGWEGHEGQMGKLRTLFGNGYYRGQCPQCGAKNEFGTLLIKKAEGFTLVEVTEAA